MAFSHRFSVALAQAIRNQAGRPWDESEFDTQLRRLMQHDSKTLWRQCSVTCRAGEADRGPMPPTAPVGPLFELGQVVGTPGALEALEEAGHSPLEFILRHQGGDWGELGNYAQTTLTEEEAARGPFATADDDKLNRWGIDHGPGRILSAYILASGVKIWIITEADRSATTILLPSEY